MTEPAKPPGPLAKLRLLVAAAEDVRLHEADLKVLAVLLDTIGKSGAGWWGFTTIARRVRKHRSAVVRAVAQLESLGYIRCHRAGGGSKDNTTRYEMGTPPTGSVDATGSVHATSGVDETDQSHPRTGPVAPTRHESVKLESVKQEQSVETIPNADAFDARAVVWKQGLSLLTKGGMQEVQARKLLGKLRGILRNDDPTLAALIEQAERDQIIDPAGWLIAAARRKGSRPVPTLGKMSDDEADKLLDAAIARLEAAA